MEAEKQRMAAALAAQTAPAAPVIETAEVVDFSAPAAVDASDLDDEPAEIEPAADEAPAAPRRRGRPPKAD